jgi:hypothetical protein
MSLRSPHTFHRPQPTYHYDLPFSFWPPLHVQCQAIPRRFYVSPLLFKTTLRCSSFVSFESPQDAKSRSTAEGNVKPEDMIPIYRKRTTIDTSGKETVIKNTYFVVDSVDALSKFGADAWDRVVCVVTTGQAWQFQRYKWNEPRQLFHNGMSAHRSKPIVQY